MADKADWKISIWPLSSDQQGPEGRMGRDSTHMEYGLVLKAWPVM